MLKEFTEKHHAFLAATFYTLLTEKYQERGEAAFVLATQRYAEQRGSRMAQRAIRDGKPLTFATYREYGEWVNTQSVKDEGCDNQGYMVSYQPDFDERVTQCPWATQFREMNMSKAGTVYCTHLDKSIVRGFNPYLVFEVPQSMHEHDCCIQTARNANIPDGTVFQKHKEYLKGFDYHCAHSYKTYSQIITAIFATGGAAISAEVLKRFADAYGSDMADVLTRYQDTDFNLI
ncbi:L-2-amino-thiazoline-4-carboxylic acid hydrolase [Pygmaiobacter massiliensis]|uniref:L-2-amino-thiazoline-4-carboxylic acid hydrolase n=1 Tax=Pygmaiobacter massiliensis TaxID=1917873 RepID=UPI001A9A3BAC|nr:L-2-amino-thiazoline-4-carboxylic acid hydrolase [Pygmaiobacter massiliensis]